MPTMKVKYTERPNCEVKGFCNMLDPDTEYGPDCAACRARLPVHTAEVLDFCAGEKDVCAVLLRDDGRIVALPLRHAELYLDQPETRENGGPAS